jgi:hypothetical protein
MCAGEIHLEYCSVTRPREHNSECSARISEDRVYEQLTAPVMGPDNGCNNNNNNNNNNNSSY